MTLTAEEGERDSLLLEALMDLVPDSQNMATMLQFLKSTKNDAFTKPMIETLTGYGTLLNVIQAATELDDLGDNLTLHDRISAGYFELTNDYND